MQQNKKIHRKTSDLTVIAEELRLGESFLVTSHVSPDGDAIGSLLAMRLLLLGMGKNRIVCTTDDPVPFIYQWLPGAGTIVRPQQVTDSFDTVVVVDVAQKDRIGRVADLIHADANVVIVDHHLENHPFGNANFVDPSYAATGEIMVELFEAAAVDIGVEGAQCSYVATATDTGGFRFENTTPRTHLIVSRLLERGLNIAEISGRVFDTMVYPKFKLLKRVLDRVQVEADGKLATTCVTLRDLAETGAKSEDIDGLITFPRNIAGVQVAAMFREADAKTTKVSLRARSGFNAAEFLKTFGGGGHAGAAGATLKMPLAQAQDEVLDALRGHFGATS